MKNFRLTFFLFCLIFSSSNLFGSENFYLGILSSLSFASSSNYMSIYEFGSIESLDSSIRQPAISNLSEVYYGAYEMNFEYGHSFGLSIGKIENYGLITEMEYTKRELAKSVIEFVPHSLAGPQNYIKYFADSFFFNAGYILNKKSDDSSILPFFSVGLGVMNYTSKGEYRVGLHTSKKEMNDNSITKGEFSFDSRIHPAVSGKLGLTFFVSDFAGVGINYRGVIALRNPKDMQKKNFISNTAGKTFEWTDDLDSGSVVADFSSNDSLFVEGIDFIDHAIEMNIRFAIGKHNNL